jgi:hypothetical protein
VAAIGLVKNSEDSKIFDRAERYSWSNEGSKVGTLLYFTGGNLFERRGMPPSPTPGSVSIIMIQLR